MSKNPHQLPQPENTFFIKWESNFLSECERRGLKINSDFLNKCKRLNLLKPVFEGEEEKRQYGKTTIRKKSIYYDLFQEKLSDIENDADSIKKAIAPYERSLPLLYDIRYFYQDEIYSFYSGGIAPPFKLSNEELKKFHLDFVGFFDELKSKFEAEKYLNKHDISKEELKKMRDKLYIDGQWGDPTSKWYPFLRTIRKADSDKFKDLKGSVLLAHDYYILAEILTYFYRDIFEDEIIDPESIFDLTGGKWRKRQCLKCNKEIKIMNLHEKYCIDCKREIAQTTKSSFKCECGTTLFRFVESDEAFNKIYSSNKKYKETNLDLVAGTKLDYGRMKIIAQCGKCGKSNLITREKGWY